MVRCIVMDSQWLWVGIGNPSPAHNGERHNAGKDALTQVLQPEGCALPAPCLLSWDGGVRVMVTKGYMNCSGEEVAQYMRNAGVPPSRLVLWHDDIDLPRGVARLSWAARAGGHHGVESVQHALGTRRWWRARLGIAPPEGKPSPTVLAQWLLSPFLPQERAAVYAAAAALMARMRTQLERRGTLEPCTVRACATY